jgi:hypothetical protein
MLLTCDQSAGQNQDIEIATRSLENMAQFEYLGTTETNQNSIREEARRD